MNGGQRPDFGGQRPDSLQIYILGISIPNARCMQNLGSIRPLGAILGLLSHIKVEVAVPLFFSGHSSSRSSVGSDYYSQISPGSISSGSSSSDHLCDSDSGNNGNVNNNDILPIGSSAHSQHTALSVTKSYNTSCSYFRSPKLNSKAEAGKVNKMVEKTRLRKTNSWAYPGGNNKSVPEFSLFSPGTSTDLLSGIRKHLSKIDLNEEELK